MSQNTGDKERPKADYPVRYDNVDKPLHYNTGEIEVIKYIRDKLTDDQFYGYCIGNTLKYISRAGLKNDKDEDLRKAEVYLYWAIKGEPIKK